MRRINSKAIFVMITITLYLLASFLFANNENINIISNYVNGVFWFILFIVSFFLFNKERVNKKYKFDVSQRVLIITFIFFILYYLSGLVVGFQKIPYALSFSLIFEKVFTLLLVIVFQEFIRNILINRSGNDKKIIVLITILLIIADLQFSLLSYSFLTNKRIFEFIVIYLCPVIAKHMLFSYMTYKADLKPTLIYRLVFSFYTFLVPIVPNFNWFLNGIVDIILPFIMFVSIRNFYNKIETSFVAKVKKNKIGMIIKVFLVFVLTVLVVLVSGLFKYQIIAIASDSMNPIFKRGDAIIIEKISDKEKNNIEVGDIIAFYESNVIVVHRVAEKVPALNNSFVYITKGDNNNSVDIGSVSDNKIIAKYKLKIKMIGYPTVWVSENIFNK